MAEAAKCRMRRIPRISTSELEFLRCRYSAVAAGACDGRHHAAGFLNAAGRNHPILKAQEAGMATADVGRHHWISSVTFCKWKPKFGGLEVSEARCSRTPEEQSAQGTLRSPQPIITKDLGLYF